MMVAAVPMMVSVAKANTVTLDTTSGYYPGNGGGEFTAYTSQNFLNNYNSDAIVKGGFETFCVETGVEFYPGTQYYYTLGDTSQPNPGIASAGSGLPLSLGAAYLYYEFATGQLQGFEYAEGASRETDDDLLQAAIWWFQGNQTYGTYNNPGTTDNEFVDLAEGVLGSANAFDAANGEYPVEILQMWSNPDDTGAVQNQLVLVPDGGLTAGMLGMGLFGMGLIQFWRRKFFKGSFSLQRATNRPSPSQAK
jgi:hypothetical protein